MTEKLLSLTPNPPRTPVFYTLTKIHKPTLVGRPTCVISRCDGPTERISSFVGKVIQSIGQSQDSYLKDTTDFMNFVEKTKVSADVILVSMDVTSLYTNIPQREGINTVCQAYHEIFRIISPLFQSGTSEKCLVLFLRKSLSIQWKRLLTKPWYCYGNENGRSFC